MGSSTSVRRRVRLAELARLPSLHFWPSWATWARKPLDHLVYEGHLIATRALASGLERLGVTGFEGTPVRSPRRAASDKFVWLRVTGAFPPLDSYSTGYKVVDCCPLCRRAGHYGDLQQGGIPFRHRSDALRGHEPVMGVLRQLATDPSSYRRLGAGWRRSCDRGLPESAARTHSAGRQTTRLGAGTNSPPKHSPAKQMTPRAGTAPIDARHSRACART